MGKDKNKMKEILVTYTFQNEQDKHEYRRNPRKDKMENSYFVELDNTNIITLQKIIDTFPPWIQKLYPGKGYHFRFFDQIAKNMNCWVDIRNLKAKVPIINRMVKMKVLLTPDHSSSKLFQKYIEKRP